VQRQNIGLSNILFVGRNGVDITLERMPRRLKHLPILLAAALSVVAAAADGEALTTAPEMEAFLLQHIPMSTPIASAKAQMESIGFGCEWYSGSIIELLPEPLLICTQAASSATRWAATLTPVNGQLSSVHVRLVKP
jgi:hypothetical protein